MNERKEAMREAWKARTELYDLTKGMTSEQRRTFCQRVYHCY